jgi:DnaA family protein
MPQQLILDWGLRTPSQFSTFLADGNEPVVAAVQGLAPGSAPLYLWGPQGSGKTHLLQAAVRHWRDLGRATVVLDPEGPWVEPDWDRLEGRPWLLVLDHADRWTAFQQQLAFACFIQAVSLGGIALSAGRVPPVDLPLRDDIRTRLAWGDVLSLKALSEPSVARLWTQAAAVRGLRGAEELLPYVLRHQRRDPGSLLELLDQLDRYSLVHQRVLTIPLLREMLGQQG